MTTDQLKSTVKTHRRSALVGGAFGMALLIAFLGYQYAMTPARPDVHSAPAATVVSYISNDRGLAKLTQIEQQRFLAAWEQHVRQEPHKTQLRDCFKNIDEDSRHQFAESIFRHIKRGFIEDATQFSKITATDEKSRFIRSKMPAYFDQAQFIKDVAVGFKNDFSGNPDEVQRYLIEHTTAEERSIGEPYFEALKRVREQVKKEDRARQTAASNATP